MDLRVPLSLDLFFGSAVLLTLFFLLKATRSKLIGVGSVVWLLVQSGISASGFYRTTATLPPRLVLALGPPLILVLTLLLVPAGRRWIDRMDLKWTVLLHSVRILVEMTLYWLFLYKQVPALMTFEAGNLDMLSGLTAPILWWAYSRGIARKKALLVWNLLCLFGLMNAVVRALLSAPFPFQRFAFTQPNVAILHFPFLLLPAFIVPAVLLCHVAIFRKLAAQQL